MTISPKTQRLLNFAAQLLFWISLIGLTVAYGPRYADFRGYYAAAMAVREGLNPYNYDNLAPILLDISGYVANNPYYYPPYFALALVPFTLLDFEPAKLIWKVANALLFFYSLRLSSRTLAVKENYWVYTLLLLLFGFVCLRGTQAGILLFYGFALLLHGMQQQKWFAVAFGLSLLALKPNITALLGLVAGLYLLWHNRKFLLYSIAWLGTLMGIATLFIPTWWQFGNTRGLWLSSDGTQRINATLYHYLSFQHDLSHEVAMLVASGLLILIIGLLYLTRHDFERLMMVAFSGSLMITPYAYQYDFVPLCFVMLFLLKQRWQWNFVFLPLFAVVLLAVWASETYLVAMIVFVPFVMESFLMTKSQKASPQTVTSA